MYYFHREDGHEKQNHGTFLSILVGGLGVDRFYLGFTGLGILKLLTGGVFGILWLIDIIRIATGSLVPADGSPYEETAKAAVVASTSFYDDLEKLAKLHSLAAVMANSLYAIMSLPSLPSYCWPLAE